MELNWQNSSPIETVLLQWRSMISNANNLFPNGGCCNFWNGLHVPIQSLNFLQQARYCVYKRITQNAGDTYSADDRVLTWSTDSRHVQEYWLFLSSLFSLEMIYDTARTCQESIKLLGDLWSIGGNCRIIHFKQLKPRNTQATIIC